MNIENLESIDDVTGRPWADIIRENFMWTFNKACYAKFDYEKPLSKKAKHKAEIKFGNKVETLIIAKSVFQQQPDCQQYIEPLQPKLEELFNLYNKLFS